MSKVVITGASGFVGSVVLSQLSKSSYTPLIVRRHKSNKINEFDEIVIDSISSKTNWGNSLSGCDVVIHCAARAHVMNDVSINPLEEFREVNTDGTLNLARQAVKSGIKRFIFISTIKVNGESTELNTAFKADDDCMPIDPYAVSKYEAEQGLQKIASETGMEVIIIRPPLVYGPSVKGNFSSMLKLISTSIPLPFGAIKNNLRSLVSVDNLVDLIITCINHPRAANKTFLVSDDEDLSTTRMFELLSCSLGKSKFMLPVPEFIFRVMGKLIGKSAVIERLCDNLQVDISETKSILAWKPIINVKEAFAKTAEHYINNKISIGIIDNDHFNN